MSSPCRRGMTVFLRIAAAGPCGPFPSFWSGEGANHSVQAARVLTCFRDDEREVRRLRSSAIEPARARQSSAASGNNPTTRARRLLHRRRPGARRRRQLHGHRGAKDLVISGGFNVYPKEAEAEIDAIDGVLESAVIGVPHPDFGRKSLTSVRMISSRTLKSPPSRNTHRHCTRPQRSRQHQRQCRRPQRSRQQRRQPAWSMLLLSPLITLFDIGIMGMADALVRTVPNISPANPITSAAFDMAHLLPAVRFDPRRSIPRNRSIA